MNKITEHHSTAAMEYDGKGILVVTIKDDVELSLQDIIEHREIAARLTQGKPHCVLAIAGQRTQATSEARQYAASNVPIGRVAEAVIIGSLPVRLLGNFYLQFHKPGVPTKMFDDRNEAMKWLELQLKLRKKGDTK
jgi:Asp/Glu/hydantoin racemase